jgi:hypothetical protein
MKKLLLLLFSAITLNVFADCPGLTVTPYMNSTTCFGTCNGHGYVVASGGSGNYSYSFRSSTYSVLPNQVNDSVYNLCAGGYFVIVNDITNGCLDTTGFNITSPSSMATITNGNSTMCAGGAVNLVSTTSGGVAAYTYQWSPATGLASVNGPLTTASPTSTTTYVITVTDANGCTSTAFSVVNVISNPVITVNSPSVCAGSPAVLTASGGTTYNWNTGATSNPYTVTPTSTTTYTVTGTSSGCSATAVATVTVSTSPSVTVSPTAATCGACNGSIATSATGGTAYSWVGSSGFSSTLMNPSNLCAGTYTLTVTGSTGCSTTVTTTVANSSPVVATIGNIVPAGCGGACNGSATVYVTGGTAPYTYSWMPNGNTTATATNLCAGTYSVIVTDANGCDYTTSVSISSGSTISGSTSVSPTACGACNGSANITVTGGAAPYIYDWYPGTPAGDGTPAINGLCQGSYTVAVTDVNGCDYYSVVNITNTNPVYVTANFSGSTCGACNGTVTTVATGGTPPYLYSLGVLPQQTNGNFSGVCPGVYATTVTDANGCSGIYNVTVPSNNASNFTVTNIIQNESGFGIQNGSIDLSVSGSGAPYTFAWSNGANTEDIYSLGAGTYSVVVTDINGNCASYYYSISTISSYGFITGYVYNDNNMNCVYDSGDAPLTGYYISITNGGNNYYGYTNGTGFYSVWVPVGSYTVIPFSMGNLVGACNTSYNVTVSGGSTVTNNNFAYNVPPVYDVCVYAWSNGIVPGFNGFYYVSLYNNGNQTANGTVYFVLPSVVDYLSSSPVATSVSGDTVYWNYSGLAGYSSQMFFVNFNTPATAPLGTVTLAYVNATLTNGVDANPGCNSCLYTRVITGSFDPNDKTVSPSGYGSTGDIPLTEDEFSYLIRFQNTGTGPAVNIDVVDTLSSLLDPMSFQMLNASHPYTVEILPGNVIKWHFDNIMLPDSNANEAASHGHVQFSINKLNAPVAGQVIENKAYIYFDFNAPVITNTAINTYTVAAEIEEMINDNNSIAVYPNPFNDQTTFVIRSEAMNESYSFEMTDVLGKTVRSLKNIAEKQFTVSRSGLENGMYFYKIINNEGVVGKGKVIIK